MSFQMTSFGNTDLPLNFFNINHPTEQNVSLSSLNISLLDTLPKPSKYQGYRLYLTQIKVEKETNNWVRITFTAINTGEKEVDFGKKGREHWVQVLFDDSIRRSKLGGFRDNIRQELYNINFKLEPGKIVVDQELKFSKILEWSQPKTKESESEVIVLSSKVVEERLEAEDIIADQEKCADLVFSDFKIVEKGKKHVVLEYAVENIGKGPAPLKIKEKGEDILIGLRVFLSGAPIVSRASKELGMDVLRVPYYQKELYPGEKIIQQTEIQTKAKTKFLKYLVLQIDSYRLMRECDRRNNESAVILE
jgi:hypothetical protein